MKVILASVLFFFAISAATYYVFVALMAERYGVSFEDMLETTNEVLLASPMKTIATIVVIGLLSYGATWFSFRRRR